MGRMVDEIGDYLEAQGVMGGASPWTSARYVTPPEPDQVVTVGEFPGAPSQGRVDQTFPGLQIRVRGAKRDVPTARDKLQECEDKLHKFTGTLTGTYYIAILAQGSGLYLGKDAEDRPMWAQNYRVTRSR
jgi:hypothetical protein